MEANNPMGGDKMTFKQFKYLVKSDLYRYCGQKSIGAFIKHMLTIPGFKYSFYMRLCKYLSLSPITKYSVFIPARLMLQHYTYKFGIEIPYKTKVGSGFYIGHFSCIIVSPRAVIGKNCNISQGVTLGMSSRGKNKGYPTIGDNVYIGPGAKIVGNVKVGNNVAIGANCVVTKDVPDNGVVVGIPGEVISYGGSEGYVIRTDY